MAKPKDKTRTVSAVTVVKEAALPVRFTTLVLRVAAIAEHWPGGIKAYQKGPAWGMMNDSIAVLAEMMSPAPSLERFIEEQLQPLGFEEGRDFVIGEEELMLGVARKPTPKPTELAWCRGLPWVRSVATKRGWYVEGV